MKRLREYRRHFLLSCTALADWSVLFGFITGSGRRPRPATADTQTRSEPPRTRPAARKSAWEAGNPRSPSSLQAYRVMPERQQAISKRWASHLTFLTAS